MRQPWCITSKIVRQDDLTTQMIMHNLAHARERGDRLVMMNRGRISQALGAEVLGRLSAQDLLSLFWETQARDDTSLRLTADTV